MKHRTGLPADLMMLLVWPLLLVFAIGIMAGYAMQIFNWWAGSH